LLLDSVLLRARIHGGVGLGGEDSALGGDTIDVLARVHGLLESTILPSEDVVTVLSVTSANFIIE